MDLNIGTFAEGFVAKLITSGTSYVQPHSFTDRKGFQKVAETIDQSVNELRIDPNQNRVLYRQLVRLRNDLQSSNAGSFDVFETALRNLQASLTASPNPYYEEISFNASPSYAQSLLDRLNQTQQELVNKAVIAFLKARSSS